MTTIRLIERSFRCVAQLGKPCPQRAWERLKPQLQEKFCLVIVDQPNGREVSMVYETSMKSTPETERVMQLCTNVVDYMDAWLEGWFADKTEK